MPSQFKYKNKHHIIDSNPYTCTNQSNKYSPISHSNPQKITQQHTHLCFNSNYFRSYSFRKYTRPKKTNNSFKLKQSYSTRKQSSLTFRKTQLPLVQLSNNSLPVVSFCKQKILGKASFFEISHSEVKGNQCKISTNIKTDEEGLKKWMHSKNSGRIIKYLNEKQISENTNFRLPNEKVCRPWSPLGVQSEQMSKQMNEIQRRGDR